MAPCIWPLLPIVLSVSYGGSRSKSLGITLGIVSSFGLLTLSLSYLVSIFKFDPDFLRLGAAIVLGLLGLVLVVPFLSKFLEAQVSRLSGKFASKNANSQKAGFGSGFLIGFTLGIVWTPCAGPILATIATLAGTRAVNWGIVLTTVVYLAGIAIPLFLFSLGSVRVFSKINFINKYTGRVQQIFGILLIIMAILIFKGWDKTISATLLDKFPSYSNFLTRLETTGGVQKELDQIKNGPSQEGAGAKSSLKILGDAPDFVVGGKWLNTDKPLSIRDLRGKVVLVDFWTYTCINCIRTLPYVTSWYEKYKDKNFVVVGVHTPEFEFEKKADNVSKALVQYKIHYPVVQDNDYKTWSAYRNQYWPAKYLIDASGKIRYSHFGEGQYEETEKNIQALIEEAGQNVNMQLTPDDASGNLISQRITPETYLGMLRAENFASQPKPIIAGPSDFSAESSLPLHYFAYRGRWNWQDEYAECISNCSLFLHFSAKKVHLVLKGGDLSKIKVNLDEKAVGNFGGDDVSNSEVTISGERLYNLVNLSKVEDHVLRLDFDKPGAQVYAFTFGD